MKREESIALLRSMSTSAFDPRVVDKFVEHVEEFDQLIQAEDIHEQVASETSSFDYETSTRPDAGLASDVLGTPDDAAGFRSITEAQREVFALHEIAQTIGSSLNLNDTVTLISNKLRAIVPFDTCIVFIVDDKSGKAIRSVVLGAKSMKQSGSDSAFGGGSWPDGRYVMVGADIQTVALVTEPFSNVEAKPEEWLNKDWFKVEKIKSISFTLPTPRPEFSTPEKTFDRWRKALGDGAMDKAIDCYALVYQGMLAKQMELGEAKGGIKQMRKEIEGTKFQIKGTATKGDSATLKVLRQKGDESDTGEIAFVRENGEWKMLPPQ